MRRLTLAPTVAALALALGGCGLLGAETGDGPGTRTAFVELGTFSGPSREGPRATRLGPQGQTDRMYANLVAADVDNLPQAHEALIAEPPKGEIGLAFVLAGCQNTGARLEVDGQKVSATLTGAENVNCGQAEYFLATFTVPPDELVDDWTLEGAE